MPIQVLSDDVINKIAAGEVIERPASVVKELVENALDAGATSIVVDVREGGKSLIKVTDNGEGFAEEDLPLSIQRHATSKISHEDDLITVSTLGFRGEALASIAAIADVSIATHQKGKTVAQILRSMNGEVSLSPGSHPVGTTIEVKNIFSRQPVRKEYLQNIQKEFAAISAVVLEYATIHHDIFFQLTHNDKTVFLSPPTKMFENIVHLYGKDIATQLIPLTSSYEGIHISGYVSKPYYTRADKHHIHVFMNQRSVVSPEVTKALLEAYHRLLHGNRFPFAVLNITIDPSTIDVNVHPQKTEVRLQNGDAMRNAVTFAVHQALQDHDVIPDAPLAESRVDQRINAITSSKYLPPKGEQQTLEATNDVVSQDIRVLGIVHNCYIIAEDEKGILLVDQHGADERINYEVLLAQYENKAISTQQLMQPKTLEVSAEDSVLLDQYQEELKSFGFVVENFGTNSFLLRALPVIVGRQQLEQVLFSVLDEIRSQSGSSLEEIKDVILASMACRMSVMKGDTLQVQQATTLIKNLLTCSAPYSCAHGRPTVIRFADAELEKRFKRCGHSYNAF